MMGIKMQKYIGTCKVPWRPITIDQVQENVALLKRLNPKVVGLSAHDSCDASIVAFRDTFLNVYREIKVGEKIIIGSGK